MNNHLSYPDFLTVVHEYWYPADEDRQHLEEAFDVLDPKRTAKLMVDDFTNLLRNSDWSEEDIELILSQVLCADGYFLYDGKISFFLFTLNFIFNRFN
jgi:Ca2+-binding EF-hand superfamily protein